MVSSISKLTIPPYKTYSLRNGKLNTLVFLPFFKFVNSIIKRGRKLFALIFFRKIFINIKQYCFKSNTVNNPHLIFLSALNNIQPSVFLRPIVLGGITYMVPNYIIGKKKLLYAILWIFKLLREKKKSLSVFDVSDCLIKSYEKVNCVALNKKLEWHKLAVYNRDLVRFLK